MSGAGEPDEHLSSDDLPPLVELDLGDDHAIASVSLGAAPPVTAGRPGTVELAPDDVRWMGEALAMAEHGLDAGELPWPKPTLH